MVSPRLATTFPDLADATSDENDRPSQPITLTDAAKSAQLTETDGRGLLFDRDVVAFYGESGLSREHGSTELRLGSPTLRGERNPPPGLQARRGRTPPSQSTATVSNEVAVRSANPRRAGRKTPA